MFFVFDPNYIWFIVIPTMILSAVIQSNLKSTFAKYSKVSNRAGMTGRQVAEALFERTELDPIPLERTPQPLGDHYDPGKNVVRLSPPVGEAATVAGMAVAAHELGHVEQYQQGSGLIRMRGILLPAVQFSPTIAYMAFMFGLLFNLTDLYWVAIFFFGLTVLFSILTLPVELDASKRAMRLLKESKIVTTKEDETGARKVLNAAAMTYLGAAVTSVLQLLYYISLINRSQGGGRVSYRK
jgi:Zn-dependent membrane protease YugP